MSFNIYVRFKDVSSDNGWGQVIYDSAPSLDDAISVLHSIGKKSVTLLGRDRGFVITRNDSGSIYDDAEHVEAIALVIDGRSGKLGVITNDSYSPTDVIWMSKFGSLASAFEYIKNKEYFKSYYDKNKKAIVQNDPVGLWKNRTSTLSGLSVTESYVKHISRLEDAIEILASSGHKEILRNNIISHFKRNSKDVKEISGKDKIAILFDLFYIEVDPLSFYDIYDVNHLIWEHDLLEIIRNSFTPLDILAKPLLKLV